MATEKKTRAPARKRATKGDVLECEVCGFSVTVDEVCGCAEVHEILCCGEPMKARAPTARAKAKAKPARRAKAAVKA